MSGQPVVYAAPGGAPPVYAGAPPVYAGAPAPVYAGAPPPAPVVVAYTTAPTAAAAAATAPVRLYDMPAAVTCPHCRAAVTTRTRYQTGLLTWVIAGGMCFFGCFLGCCFIPFCVDACKDVIHTCPSCNQIIGKYERMH